MRVFWAVLAGILGGVAGYIFTALIGVMLLSMTDTSGDSGGGAMGVFFGLAPLGALVGAFGSVFLSLSATKPDPAKEANKVSSSSGSETRPQEATTEKQSPPLRRGDFQGLIAVGILMAIVAGIYYSLFYEYVPPNYQYVPNKPKLLFEIQVPSRIVKEDEFFKTKIELRSWQHLFSPIGGIWREDVGDMTVFSGSFEIYNRVTDRKIWFWPAEPTFVEFNLNVPEEPVHQDEFQPWRHPDHVATPIDGSKANPLEASEVNFRSRVVWLKN